MGGLAASETPRHRLKSELSNVFFFPEENKENSSMLSTVKKKNYTPRDHSSSPNISALGNMLVGSLNDDKGEDYADDSSCVRS